MSDYQKSEIITARPCTGADGRLQIGLSTGLFGARAPVEEDFCQLRDAQINQIEIRIKPGYVDVDDRSTIRQLAKWVDHYQINILSVHGPSGYPGVSMISKSSGEMDWLANPDDAVRKLAVRRRCETLEIARFLGAKQVIIEYECYDHAPYWPHESVPEILYHQATERWRQSVTEILEKACRTNIRLAIENIDGLSCAEQANFVLQCHSNQIGLCFDSSHASYDMSEFDKNLNLFLPDLISTHLSDNDGLPGRYWVDRHWTPFLGIINWEYLIQTIVKSTYDDCLILEVLNIEKKITDDLIYAIDKLKQLIARAL